MDNKNLLTKLVVCITGGVIVAASATTIAFSFAWFTNNNNVTQDFSGQTKGAYFADGDGSSADPYIINKPIHLYNLAWLQYTGFFNKDKKDNSTWEAKEDGDGFIDQYYFRVEADLDMTGWVLPPIGSKTKPFVGNFTGVNHVISNLTISNKIGTETGQISKHPGTIAESDFNDTDNPNIIGFFGVVGNPKFDESATELSYTKSVNSISDLYLDNVKIYTYGTDVLCGILAGYVNGSFTNAGVHSGNLNVAKGTTNISKFTNVSSYTLIGDYNKAEYKYDQDKSGGDAGYGTSTNITELHSYLTNLGQTDGDDAIVKEGVAIPFQADPNATSLNTKSGTMTLGGRTVTKASTVATNSNATNIGYYVGGKPSSNIDSTATMRIMKDHYSDTTIDYENNLTVSTNSDVKTVPDRVKEYLAGYSSDGKTKNGHSVIRMATINNLTNTMKNDSGYYGIESGNINGKTQDIFVPNNCIWVAPIQAGTFEFVCVNENSYTSVLVIWKLKRSQAGTYSSSFSSIPDINKQEENFNDHPSAEAVGMVLTSGWRSYTAYYYGTPVTSEDIENGVEFAITLYQAYGANYSIYLTYLDIGSDGGSDGDTRTTLTGFDFVKEEDGSLVKIKNYDSATKKYVANDAYVKSEVTFTISGTSTSLCSYFFKRTGDGTDAVLFCPDLGLNNGFTLSVNGTSANAKYDSSLSNEDTTSA